MRPIQPAVRIINPDAIIIYSPDISADKSLRRELITRRLGWIGLIAKVRRERAEEKEEEDHYPTGVFGKETRTSSRQEQFARLETAGKSPCASWLPVLRGFFFTSFVSFHRVLPVSADKKSRRRELRILLLVPCLPFSFPCSTTRTRDPSVLLCIPGQ